MSVKAPPPPDAALWQVQYLRLIAFPVQPQFAVDQNWWKELTGGEPESSTRKKHEREDEGVFDGSVFTLSIDLLRIQWTAAARLVADELPDGPPLLGQFIERKDWFRNAMARWLLDCPSITRLAFAAVLVQPVEDKQAGYLLLDRYLRAVDVDPRSSDLIYRINRHRQSTIIPDLRVNRLCTWFVPRYAPEIRAQMLGGAASKTMPFGEMFGCAVELDVNTAPEPADRVLPHDTLPQLFEELANMGTDIAAHGDLQP